jgi:hypothetical protein
MPMAVVHERECSPFGETRPSIVTSFDALRETAVVAQRR